MMRKVRIKRPGRSSGYNSGQFPVYYPGTEWTAPRTETNNSLPAVPWEEANLEAEGGETALIPNQDGLPAHFNINGPKHSEGGVPLNLADNSFIFSDTRDMKIGGPILSYFGKPEDTKKKYTPADLAKKYDINKFRKQLQDTASDPIQVKTAEMMIANYNKKLAQLALVQEAKKGFPKGIPDVALPYMAVTGVEPQQVLPLAGPSMNSMEGASMEGIPRAQMGMPVDATSVNRYYDIEGMDPMAPVDRSKLYPMTDLQMQRFKPGPYSGVTEVELPWWAPGVASGPLTYAAMKIAPHVPGAAKAFAKATTAGIKKAAPYGAIPFVKTAELAKAHPKGAFAAGVSVGTTAYNYYNKRKKDTEALPDSTNQATDRPYFKREGGELPKAQYGMASSAWNLENNSPTNQKSPSNVIRTHKENGNTFVEYNNGTFKKVDAKGKITWGVVPIEYRNLPKGDNLPTVTKNLTAEEQAVAESTKSSTGKSSKAAATAPGRSTRWRWPGDRNDPSNASKYTDDQWNAFAKSFCPECKTPADLQKKILTAPEFADDVKRLHSKDVYGMPKNSPNDMVDNKLGHRWDFVFNKPEVAQVVEKVPPPKTTFQKKTENYVRSSDYAPWWLQDKVKTWGAAADLLRLKKYLPWAPKAAPVVPDATFVDPTRALAQIAEQTAIGTQGANVYGSPQQYNARVSEMQGKGHKAAADTLAQYENQNVGISNQFAGIKADTYNKANEYNAKTAMDLDDKTTIANQQFDSAKNMARQELRQSYIDSVTNRAMAYDQNLVSPHYKYDPSTGGMAFFYDGSDLIPSDPNNNARINEIKALVEAFPAGIPPGITDLYKSSNIDDINEQKLKMAQDRIAWQGYPRTSGTYPRSRGLHNE